MEKYQAQLALAGRVLLSGVMLWAAVFNVTHWTAQTALLAAGYGAAMGTLLLAVATGIEIVLGIPLLLGFRTRGSAAVLAAYVAVATIALHPFWTVGAAESQNELLHFVEGIAIVGGLLVIAAFGPGRISIDARQGRS
ncbi:MAG TPA: DoxX family protein [bacterium]